jgi:hypothetical protein
LKPDKVLHRLAPLAGTLVPGVVESPEWNLKRTTIGYCIN